MSRDCETAPDTLDGSTPIPALPQDALRSRIAFLGSDLNPISIYCLGALLREDRYEFLVGIDTAGGGLRRTITRIWQRHRAAGLLHRVALKIRATIQLQLRRCGLRFCHPSSLRELVSRHAIASFRCTDVNASETLRRLEAFQPELVVVANFSQILRPSILSLPPLGVINFHPSLLPKYRGPTPYYWILKNRETTSGVTVHYVDAGIDTGDIICQASHDVLPDDNERSLRQRSIATGAPLLAAAVKQVVAGTAPRTRQDETNASYYGFAPDA